MGVIVRRPTHSQHTVRQGVWITSHDDRMVLHCGISSVSQRVSIRRVSQSVGKVEHRSTHVVHVGSHHRPSIGVHDSQLNVLQNGIVTVFKLLKLEAVPGGGRVGKNQETS